MYDVAGVIWPYPSFSSITPDQIEIEHQERPQCVQHELPNPMICNTTTLGQGTDLGSRDLTLIWGQPETWLFLNKKYIIRRVLARGTGWCQHFCSAIIFSRNYSLKTKPLHLCHWPDLWRHRLPWDLNFKYQSLRLVTPDTLVFSVKL